MTKTINGVILIITTVVLFFLIFIVLATKDDQPVESEDNNDDSDSQMSFRQKLQACLRCIEYRCSKVSNMASYIGIVATVATIGITCLINIMSIRASHIDVEVVDGHHWEWGYDHYEDRPAKLHYSIDEHGHFSNIHNGMPGIWNFRIHNTGNDVANGITVKIDISGVEYGFFPQPDDYELENHNHGIGTYATISADVGSIDPDQYVDLPNYPVDYTTIDIDGKWNPEPLYDITKNTVLKLTIYSDEGLILEKTYPCECDSVVEDRVSEYEEYGEEVDEDILEYFVNRHKEEHFTWSIGMYEEKKLTYAMENILFTDLNKKLDNPYPDYGECERMVMAHEEIPSILYQDEYRYALGKLDVKNPVMRQFYHRKAVFYGRLYYIAEGYADVDEKIQIEISALGK